MADGGILIEKMGLPLKPLLENIVLTLAYFFLSYYVWPISRGNLPFSKSFWLRDGGEDHTLYLLVTLAGFVLAYSLYRGMTSDGGYLRVGFNFLAIVIGCGLAIALDFKEIGESFILYPFVFLAGILSMLVGLVITFVKRMH